MIIIEADEIILSNLPDDITVECNNIPTASTVTASSNCLGNVTVDFVENIIPGSCENSYTIERVWSAGLACGNGVSHTQLITVEDNQAPILAGVPANTNVACGTVPAPAQPAANLCQDRPAKPVHFFVPRFRGLTFAITMRSLESIGRATRRSQGGWP